MNRKIVVTLCFLVLVGAWAYVHAQPSTQPILPAGTNGRYQVIAAEIDYSGLGSNMGTVLKHKTAIRIDTQTGQTWELTEIDDAKGHGGGFYWIKSNEDK